MANAIHPISALGDTTRRTIFERIREVPSTAGALAAELPVSRPAVSQHLKVLRDAGLVTADVVGTRRIYRVDPAGLAAIRAWLDQFWDGGLAAFKAEAERIAKATKEEDDD